MSPARLVASLVAVGLTALVCGAASPAPPFSGGAPGVHDRLERVVLIARHGIRSPTHDPAALEKETGVIWPVWPVGPGQLTAHGRATLGIMMADIARYYDLACVSGQQSCLSRPAPVVWADSGDDRTRQSGQIMAEAFAAGGPATARALPAGARDPLFDGVTTVFIAQHKEMLRRDVVAALEIDSTRRPRDVQIGLERLQQLVMQHDCATAPCLTAGLVAGEKKGRPVLEGGAALASSLAENLFLVYVEVLERGAKGWVGQIDPRLLFQVLPVHEYMAQLTRRRGVLVAEKSRFLVDAIERFLKGQGVTLPDGSAVRDDVRFLAFAGHDTTLDALAAQYGLDWRFVDQPDATAPDTTLAFERWRSPDGAITYRARVFHQSLEALREGRGLDLAHGGAALLTQRPHTR